MKNFNDTLGYILGSAVAGFVVFIPNAMAMLKAVGLW